MADNFYLDNADLRFHMEQMVDWKSLLNLRGDIDAPESPFESLEEAKEANIDMLSDPLGSLAAERIAPRAEEVDAEGCRLVDGEVVFPEGLKRNLADLAEAQLTGITLDPAWGGMGFSKTFYTAATEIISRADASLMNFFGLQGIGDTIQQFADEDICAEYLPRMATGEETGAMVLTEADAGSDLGAVRTKADLEAEQDPETGEWLLKGSKRFITNGCGDVLLVLARSEDPAKYGGSRGLSFFVTRKSERVQIRRIEEKLGIHGSPTCEIYFDNAPAKLIGRRGRGLTKYTAWLMAAARLGVAAQAVGVAEAALREGRRYASEREQFGKPIAEIPAVAAMISNMRMKVEAARSLLYATSYYVDMQEAAEKKDLKQELKTYSRAADLLTPMVKYYAAEIANEVASESVQIHGGNGFMKDYPVERLFRDARITNIYEGTSQIQIDWALPRLLRGDMDQLLDSFEDRNWTTDEIRSLNVRQKVGREMLREAIGHLQGRDTEYRNLMARRLVDMAIAVYVGWLFLDQACVSQQKTVMARRWLAEMLPMMRTNLEVICSDRPRELDFLG